MTANGCSSNPDYQKIQQQSSSSLPPSTHHQHQRRSPTPQYTVTIVEDNHHHQQHHNQQQLENQQAAKTGSAGTGSPVIRQQPAPTTTSNGAAAKDEDSFCCKLSYADYCSIDGSRDMSSTSNLQSPQLHAPNCRTGRLAEKLFEDEDESDFCASCASHPKLNLWLYCLGYIGFMIFASCIFSMTEKHVEIGHKADLIRLQVEFLNRNPSVDGESRARSLCTACVSPAASPAVHPHTIPDSHTQYRRNYL